jgi:hypothetical protein
VLLQRLRNWRTFVFEQWGGSVRYELQRQDTKQQSSSIIMAAEAWQGLLEQEQKVTYPARETKTSGHPSVSRPSSTNARHARGLGWGAQLYVCILQD